MEKELILLCERNQEEKLIEKLANVDFEKISSLLDHRVGRGRDTAPLVKAFFMGLPDSSSSGRKRRQELFKACIKLLQTDKITSKQAIDLLGVLMLEVESLQGIFLAELAETYVDAIKTKTASHGKYLELLPKILNVLSDQESVTFRGDEMKGPDCKSHVINSLCSVRWESGCVLSLVAMFRDVTLSVDQLQHVMEKVIRMFPDVSLDELPPLIFQLLLLANKGHKDLLLDGIISYFSDLDANQPQEQQSEEMYSELTTDRCNRELVLQTEGTVILHVTFSASQDRQLARDFLKYVKNCGNQLVSPFTLSLALSVSKIDHCEEAIFDCLKKCIVTSFREHEKRKESFWVRERVCGEVDVSEAILNAVRQSTCVWDYVIQGLVKLGFHLMTSFGPRAAFGRVTERRTAQRNPQQRACDLGADILGQTFKVHSMARGEILDQLLRKIMIGQEGGCISHYMDLLTTTIQTTPHHFFDSINKIREVLDTVPCLPVHAAEGVLRALPPLLKISRNLKDALLIVLRKSLFSRQLETRRVAVLGYLVLLKHFKVLGGSLGSQHSQASFSSSQVSVDIHRPNSATNASNEGLCLEILNNLRRSLTQHSLVRQTLYQGLYDVISRNSQLLEPVLEFLTSHLQRYYDPDDDVIPPLKVTSCVQQGENVQLAEPLAFLLHTLQLCVLAHREDAEQEEMVVAEKLEKTFRGLTRRMLKAEMEDFELDKSADYNSATSVGQRNTLLVQLVMGVYEVLIEYNVMIEKHSDDTLENVAKLYDQYKALGDVIRDKANNKEGGGGKKGRPAQGHSTKNQPTSLLSMRCIQTLLTNLLQDRDDVDSPWCHLRQDDDFLRHVMTSSNQRLRHLAESGHVTNADRLEMKKIFTHVSSVSKLLLSEVTSSVEEGGTGSRKKLAGLMLEGLGHGITYVCLFVPHRMDEFVDILDPGKKSAGVGDEKVFSVIKRLQALMTSLLEGDDKNLKDCLLLVNMVERLARHLAIDSEHYSHVMKWVERICQKENIEDVNVARSLLHLLISMTSRVKNCLPMVRDVCQDIHSTHGDIDQEVSVEETSNYSVVNSKTVNSILALTLSRLDQELEDIEWVVARMKSELSSDVKNDSTQDSASREGHERSVCSRLGSVINSCHELIQTAVPLHSSDGIIRLLHKLYASLTNITKYYVLVYSKGHGALVRTYEKLVKLTGTHLTQHVYSFITYIQASQAELLATADQKKKGDKKKADQPVKKAQVVKEGKAVPALIFSIEEYEKFLIQLSKKSKINLMEHIKHSTNRDFRINTAALQALKAMEEEGGSSSEGGSDQENEAPAVAANSQNETVPPTGLQASHRSPPAGKDGEPAAKRPRLNQRRSKLTQKNKN